MTHIYRGAHSLRFVSLVLVFASLIGACAQTATAQNPVPMVYQPLLPTAVAPGSASFTLTVNGTGFVSGSTVLWNGTAKTTHFVSANRLTAAILSADVAHPGTASVMVVNPPSGGGTSDPLFFMTGVPSGSSSFANTNSFGSGGANIQMVAADFNGDGKVDLASAQAGGVAIFLGNGDGTFTTGQTLTGFCNAFQLNLGDFNSDGILDLLVSDACGIFVLPGKGDGTFATPMLVPKSERWQNVHYSLTAGDFNGDGKLDIALIDRPHSYMTVQLGNGDGTFGSPVTYSTDTYPTGIIAADLNRDGRLDLIASTWNGVSVFWGNGDGTFQPQMFVALPNLSHPSLVAADLNGDGNLDLAVASTQVTPSDASVCILLGNGAGGFSTPVEYYASDSQIAIVAADLNDDGILDLILSNQQNGFVSLQGNGNGTFQTAQTYFGYTNPAMAVGDFNGDGRLDVALGFDGSIEIYLQPAVGPASTTTALTSSLNPSVYGQNVTFNIQVTSSSGTPSGTVVLSDPQSIIATVTLQNGLASISSSTIPAGSQPITASYQGSSSFAPSQATLTQVISMATTGTTLTASHNPSLAGSLVEYIAYVGGQYGGLPSGTVTFTDGGTTLGTFPVNGAFVKHRYTVPGVHSVTATYSGDANFHGSSSTITEYIVAKTVTSLTTSGSPSHVGQPVTFTATVTTQFGPIPDGETVTFYDGKNLLGSAPVSSGTAAYTTSTLSAKTHIIKALYGGDDIFKKSSGKVTQVVSP